MMLWLLSALIALGSYVYYTWTKRAARRVELEAAVAKRGSEREESIRRAEKSAELVEPTVRQRIAQMDFQTLRDELQKGSVSCVDVVRTFNWKAVKAHRKTNCAVMFVKESEQWAAEWDEKAKDPSFEKPTFFGVPISLKECVPLEGYDQTRGFAQDLFHPTKQNGVLVVQMKNLGLIPYVQTNVPQSLLTYNACNPVYGRTNHPMDRERTSGGSSGGESAIIAADGSLLGIGGDVGGSIRIPCHFTGIAGIKPSHLRFSHRGVCGSVPGRPLINSNDGPMGKDIRTIVDFLREVWKDTYTSTQDPYVPPVVWNEGMYEEGKKYRVGYYLDDGWFTPIPAIQRAVLESKAHLEAAGHTVVQFHPPRIPALMKMFIRAVAVDGGAFLLNKLLNDIIDPTLYSQVLIYFVPVWLQRLLSYPVSLVFPRLGHVMRAMAMSTSELRETYADIESYRDEFAQLMNHQKLDALLCPPMKVNKEMIFNIRRMFHVLTAPPHAVPCKLFAACCYTAIFNLLDYGAGVVNVTHVTKKDDQDLMEKYPETDPWYRLAKESCKGCIGFPVGIQVAAPPYKEEIVLRLLRDIEIGVAK